MSHIDNTEALKESLTWGLLLSNLAYLVPACVTMYQMSRFVPVERRMKFLSGLQIVIILIFVALVTSWSYHDCFGADSYPHIWNRTHHNDNKDSMFDVSADCQSTDCKHHWFAPQSWLGKVDRDVSRVTDHQFALMAMVVVLINIVPLAEELRSFLLVLSMTWMSFTVNAGQTWLGGALVMILSLLIVRFWWKHRTDDSKTTRMRNIAWGSGVALALCSLVVFNFDYGWAHVTWHVTSALAAACFIAQQANHMEADRL